MPELGQHAVSHEKVECVDGKLKQCLMVNSVVPHILSIFSSLLIPQLSSLLIHFLSLSVAYLMS